MSSREFRTQNHLGPHQFHTHSWMYCTYVQSKYPRTPWVVQKMLQPFFVSPTDSIKLHRFHAVECLCTYEQNILAPHELYKKWSNRFFASPTRYHSFYHSPQQHMLRIAEVPFSMYVHTYSTINTGERAFLRCGANVLPCGNRGSQKKSFKKFQKKKKTGDTFLINPSSNPVVPNFLQSLKGGKSKNLFELSSLWVNFEFIFKKYKQKGIMWVVDPLSIPYISFARRLEGDDTMSNVLGCGGHRVSH